MLKSHELIVKLAAREDQDREDAADALAEVGRNRRSGKVGGLGYYTGIALGT